MLLVDDYTKMTVVFFLKNKSEDFENFKIYKEMVENEMDSRIKCLRSDNGGEFTSKEFMDYCRNHEIKMQFSVARTPQQNGVVERKNRTVQEMARTMIMDSKLTDIFDSDSIILLLLQGGRTGQGQVVVATFQVVAGEHWGL
jgi:transposase InsO family protein